MSEAATLLGAWHDFYVVLGTASGGLIGAMFVVASIGSGFLTKERAKEVRIFLTPSIVHLTTVLLGCALALVPSLEPGSLTLLFGLTCLGGLIYSGRIGLQITRHGVERSDRFWYAAAPMIGYATIGIAVLLLLLHRSRGPETLATGLAALLLAGIRNAWDLILFLVAQAKGSS